MDGALVDDKAVNYLVDCVLSQEVAGTDPAALLSPSNRQTTRRRRRRRRHSAGTTVPIQDVTVFADPSTYQSVKKYLWKCLTHRTSASLLVFGENDESCALVYRALIDMSHEHIAAQRLRLSSGSSDKQQQHKRHRRQQSGGVEAENQGLALEDSLLQRVAVVHGGQVGSDADALLSIANQLLLRRHGDKEVNAALEDLEEFFAQCRVDGLPAVIVIENFHHFAFHKRQTLIYTLLDFMHKRELFFIVCSISPFD
jgi:hypothetical protein